MKYDAKGIVATVFFHVALLLILIFMGFRTPLPLPAERGLMVNFGTMETGRGNVEPTEKTVPKAATAAPSPEAAKKTVVTQDFEEAPALPAKKETKKTNTPKPEPKAVEKKAEPVEKKEERKVNPLTLYKGSSQKDSEGEGLGGAAGNQGEEQGVTDGSHFVGSAGDMGVTFSLDGRHKLELPNPSYDYQKEGIVVVQITVNRDGRVTDALAGVKGSTTLDDYLLEAAKRAALSSSFNRKPDAPMYQKGTITYRFKLK
jgi:colicin import membrane protein